MNSRYSEGYFVTPYIYCKIITSLVSRVVTDIMVHDGSDNDLNTEYVTMDTKRNQFSNWTKVAIDIKQN